jgi:hypothetical protein
VNRAELLISTLAISACFSEDPVAPGTDASSSSGSTTSSASTSTTTSSVDSSESTTTGDYDDTSSSTTEVADESSSSTGEPVTDWALYFGGRSSATSTEDLDLALGNEFTVEAWVRVDSSDALGTIVSFLGVGTSGWSFGFNFESDLDFGFYDNNGAWNAVAGTNASSLSPGWTHVAAIKSGTSIYLYVDGVLVQTAPSSFGTSSPTVPLVLGNGLHGAGQYFAIDDLRISTGRRYQVNFEPSYEIEADADAVVRALFDEGMGTVATSDGAVAATFDLGEPSWIEGSMP